MIGVRAEKQKCKQNDCKLIAAATTRITPWRLNSDGRADLIFQNNSNAFYLSLSTGTGFAAPVQVAKHGRTFLAGQAQYADVNGDGRADLIFQSNDNRFLLSLSTGTGFAAPVQIVDHAGAFVPGQAHYADVNGDSLADLILQDMNNDFWLWFATEP